MEKLKDLKISVSQMPVQPGRPDLNAHYIIEEMKKAEQRGADIVIFPEMSVSGYIIGDLYEDESFVKDVVDYNEQIIKASSKTAVIFGSIMIDEDKVGEDGRIRKHNGALVAQNGRLVGYSIKSLQPNYRIFDDDRHFYSLRKDFDEKVASGREKRSLSDLYSPIVVKTKVGDVKAGVILCEDMWHDDYPHNPTENLVEKGAEIVINLSASPWTWQKNRKRHQVVKDLKAGVPFVYVNNAGIQNTGKNVVTFDGSSTIYDSNGEKIFVVEPYSTSTRDFVFAKESKAIKEVASSDTAELYLAITTAIREFVKLLPEEMRRVFIGLSGGIDSALTTALYADVLGKDKVITINMPSQYNSEETKSIAKKVAENMGVEYRIVPIQEIVDTIAGKTDCKVGSLAYENIQARTRMEVLAAEAQNEGCVFSANWNKVEASFGYGTLYGDMAGFLAVLGDMTKYEVYQLAKYMNDNVFEKEVIPSECFNQEPSAELSTNQVDPFDYGRLERRGYHDEMVRAFTEFRHDPEWFMESYMDGQLEEKLKIEKGTLSRLFPTSSDFIADLEKNWQRFRGAYFKRVQGPPIPIVSKRAFGTDLRESILPPYLTRRYYKLKEKILNKVSV